MLLTWFGMGEEQLDVFVGFWLLVFGSAGSRLTCLAVHWIGWFSPSCLLYVWLLMALGMFVLMFLFNGSMFPFLFRVLVTLISVYTFSVCYFCGFVTFDLNIFLHLIKKKKEIKVLGKIEWFKLKLKAISISSKLNKQHN